MKNFLFFVSLLILFINISLCQEVSLREQNQIAIKFYQSKLKNDILHESIEISEVVNLVTEGNLEINLFRFAPKGFVILTNDKRLKPVLGYSIDGKFEKKDMPMNFTNWLRMYQSEIELMSKTDQIKKNPEWNEIQNSNSLKLDIHQKSVNPLIKSKWGQGWPYNTDCPNNSPVGCTATATGQIIRYWGDQLYGTGYFEFIDNTYGLLSANFGNTEYNISNLPLEPVEENSDLSKFLYHVAIALTSTFTEEITSSHTLTIATALVQFFNCSYNTIEYYGDKSEFTDDKWIQMMKNELDHARPIAYSGYRGPGQDGHAFVCDGYDSQNYFHFNWGWEGNGDGYYSLSLLQPTGSINDYTYKQKMVIGIQPNDGSTINKSQTLSGINKYLHKKNTVTTGTKINLLPGTKMIFGDSSRFDIYGSIIAKGQPDNLIKFTTNDENTYWHGLFPRTEYFNNFNTDTLFLSYCKIERGDKSSAEFINDHEYNGGAINTRTNWSYVNIFENCQFINNKANRGGALAIYKSDIVRNCVFENNTAYYGGAISIFYSNVIENCIFEGNIADLQGGAIWSYSNTDINVHNCDFSDNSAFLGGGIYLQEGNLMVDGCIFTGNNAVGGALQINNSKSSYVINSHFRNQYSPGYGSVLGLSFNSCLDFINNTVADNTSNNLSGIISIDDSQFKIINSIFYNNFSDVNTTPSKRIIFLGENSNLEAYNSYISKNWIELGYNSEATIDKFENCDFIDRRIPIDPKIQLDENNIYVPDDNSKLVNGGRIENDNLIVDSKDIYGNNRIYGGRIDIGAVENQSIAVDTDILVEPGFLEFNIVESRLDSGSVKVYIINYPEFVLNEEVISGLEFPFSYKLEEDNQIIIYCSGTSQGSFIDSLTISSNIKTIHVPVSAEIIISNVENEDLPTEFVLTQNYPNPFNPTTTIEYAIPKAGNVKIILFNSLGQEIKTLLDKNLTSGYYNYQLDGSSLSSGVYFYQICTKDFIDTKKMVLLK